MPTQYEPDAFDGIDADAGYNFERDNGSYSGPEQIDTFMDIDYEPGEIWEVYFAVTLSSENTDGPIVLEIFDDSGDYIINKTIDTYSGNFHEVRATIPAYVLNDDFSPPASGSGSADLSFQIAGSDGGNYWAWTEQVRVRGPLQTDDEFQGSGTESFSSGPP